MRHTSLLRFLGLAICMVLAAATWAAAQTAEEQAATTAAHSSALNAHMGTAGSTPGMSPDGDSLITADDVLDIYVMDVPELSRQYRVAPTGTVTLPLLTEPVKAGGLTPSEFSDALAKQLHDSGLVTDPHIVVTIISSRLKSVAITGAVKMPQIYPVLGKTTLLDMLSQAQGLNDDAGNTAIVSRGKLGETVTGQTTQSVDLKKLLDTGSVQYNLAIFPGDRITIPRAGIVYVVGAVNKPGGFIIKSDDNGMTVLQALAMAEDSKGTAQRQKSVIIRPDKNSPDGRQQIPCNLNLILANKAPDQKLYPNDILFVPDSAAKKAFARGLEAALQTATGLAVYGRY